MQNYSGGSLGPSRGQPLALRVSTCAGPPVPNSASSRACSNVGPTNVTTPACEKPGENLGEYPIELFWWKIT
ncbi:hypothetical protein [Microcoleus sp. bin38.metabat.b11b12b14.051]|uniref:hypothetical protein n=1 Tax=Microcoleus sp. bin38.metabat.b11b12b14.051 TaxID=2742709 RepID=UPI0025D2C923|nr:hypothetical protein [Microcoleus sp. bin38.metabat.b11b12b14.051]